MRTALLLSTLLCLAGCNYAPSTSITTTTVNGADVLHSEVSIQTPGSARFECAESASGSCKYAVFTNDCTTAKDSRTVTCTTRVLDRFTLAKGESKELGGLPTDFRHCVKQDREPSIPGCID
jgi:hypothetical protein